MYDEIDLIPKRYIAVDNIEDCNTLVKILISQHYAVMVTKEEQLYIVSYVYSHNSDRNEVVFMTREDYESVIFSDEEKPPLLR